MSARGQKYRTSGTHFSGTFVRGGGDDDIKPKKKKKKKKKKKTKKKKKKERKKERNKKYTRDGAISNSKSETKSNESVLLFGILRSP